MHAGGGVEQKYTLLFPLRDVCTSAPCFPKLSQQQSASKSFKKLYSFDPSPLFHPNYMSDEDSGPEESAEDKDNEGEESMREWREAMIKELGYTGPVEDHEDVSILEVIDPMWRSKFVNALCSNV
jgi:hypothetical protein